MCLNRVPALALIAAVMITIILIQPASAQSQDSADSVRSALLPAFSYDNDLGLIGGGLYNRFHYRDQINPYFSYTQLAGIVSTRGLISLELEHDKPRVFQSDMRLNTRMFVFRFLQDRFFGVGNYGSVANRLETDPDYFLFNSFSMGFSGMLRKPVIGSGNYRELDLYGTVNLRYETPWGNGAGQLIAIPSEKPPGVDGGRTFQIGLGMIWEGRNRELRPTKGSFADISLETGQTFWGSSFDNAILSTESAYYFTFHLLRDITFAQRLMSRFTTGDVPYWLMAYAGDAETLRGYPANRFLDDHAMILNTELRTWLFDLPSIDSRIGGNIFLDAGRTFPDGTAVNDWISDLKYTIGFSGVATLFTPDLIIRADVGFSDEDIGVYISTGYLF